MLSEPSNMIIDEFSFMTPLENMQIVFFGKGAEKCKNIIKHDNAIFVDNISPEAQFMAISTHRKFLNKEFENVAYFEPLYIKPFIATTPKNKLW
jgi:tRNA threonylcarbamoyladenosine biosynthesis protein TsaB